MTKLDRRTLDTVPDSYTWKPRPLSPPVAKARLHTHRLLPRTHMVVAIYLDGSRACYADFWLWMTTSLPRSSMKDVDYLVEQTSRPGYETTQYADHSVASHVGTHGYNGAVLSFNDGCDPIHMHGAQWVIISMDGSRSLGHRVNVRSATSEPLVVNTESKGKAFKNILVPPMPPRIANRGMIDLRPGASHDARPSKGVAVDPRDSRMIVVDGGCYGG